MDLLNDPYDSGVKSPERYHGYGSFDRTQLRAVLFETWHYLSEKCLSRLLTDFIAIIVEQIEVSATQVEWPFVSSSDDARCVYTILLNRRLLCHGHHNVIADKVCNLLEDSLFDGLERYCNRSSTPIRSGGHDWFFPNFVSYAGISPSVTRCWHTLWGAERLERSREVMWFLATLSPELERNRGGVTDTRWLSQRLGSMLGQSVEMWSQDTRDYLAAFSIGSGWSKVCKHLRSCKEWTSFSDEDEKTIATISADIRGISERYLNFVLDRSRSEVDWTTWQEWPNDPVWNV